MKKVVVVSASWCSQCGPYKRALKQAGVEFDDCDADLAENHAFITQNGVRGLPTTLVFDGGLCVGSSVGNNVPKVLELLK